MPSSNRHTGDILPEWPEIHEALAAANLSAVIATGGEAASLLRQSLEGTSSAILSRSSLFQLVDLTNDAELGRWLGRIPERRLSSETALGLAVRGSLSTEEQTGDSGRNVLGLGCVAGTSGHDHRRLFLGLQTASMTQLYAALHPPAPRHAEARFPLFEPLIRVALSRAIGLECTPWRQTAWAEHVTFQEEHPAPLLQKLWTGSVPLLRSLPDGTFEPGGVEPSVGMLSGAFNPLHEGHTDLKRAAEKWLTARVRFEMSLVNADKPPLDYLTLAHRRRQFRSEPLLLTREATFAGKAKLLPGARFVMGVDTAERVVQPRFYNGSEKQMHDALSQIRAAGCRFLVAGRKSGTGFFTLSDVDLPGEFAALFEELPSSEFRSDISSTHQRREQDPPDE